MDISWIIEKLRVINTWHRADDAEYANTKFLIESLRKDKNYYPIPILIYSERYSFSILSALNFSFSTHDPFQSLVASLLLLLFLPLSPSIPPSSSSRPVTGTEFITYDYPGVSLTSDPHALLHLSDPLLPLHHDVKPNDLSNPAFRIPFILLLSIQ